MTDQAAPGLIYLNDVRLSFPKLAKPEASAPNAEPKFSAAFLMEPSHPGWASFHSQVAAIAQTAWGAQAQQVVQFIQNDKRLRCYGWGEEQINKETMQPYDGYPGMVFISANNAAQPALYGSDGNPLMNASALYGGCYVNAVVKPWPQDNTHGRAIRCELVGVQFLRDGEAFGAAPVDPSTLFAPVPGAPAPMAGQPPAGYPPQGQPPAGYPPQGQPPAQQPPAGYPPQGQPPAQQPPAGYPPQGQPPAQQPPAGYPPQGQPPAQQPPGQWNG